MIIYVVHAEPSYLAKALLLIATLSMLYADLWRCAIDRELFDIALLTSFITTSIFAHGAHGASCTDVVYGISASFPAR